MLNDDDEGDAAGPSVTELEFETVGNCNEDMSLTVDARTLRCIS